MTKYKKKYPYRWRYWLIVSVLLLVTVGLAARLLFLGVFERSFLQQQGNARTIRTVDIPAYRGMITDRNGESLAISTPVDSIWVNPQHLDPQTSKEDIDQLATMLDLSPQDIMTKVNNNKDREFIYLRRHINPSIAEQINKLKIPGVYLQREFKRFYPEGEVFAQVVGFTNVDDKGQEGLELAYNNWLQGVPGKKKVLKDRLSRVVEDLGVLRDASPGHNLVLSLDRRIQYLAYRELNTALVANKATSGSVVVLDARTGETLAMVSLPSYNPNKRPDDRDGRYRNRALTDVFEPGSTIKPFSVANALLSGKYTAETVVNTSPGWMVLDGKVVRDEHNLGSIDVRTILQRSSNMGITKLTLSLPANSLWTMLHDVGFGMRTGTNFPGESAGTLADRRVWSPFTLATLSFGYGLSVTATQLASAYSVFANHGAKVPVSLLRLDKAPQATQIFDPKVSQQILEMLESVVEKGGTAVRAQVTGYRVTGKTGTVRMIGSHGYESNHHIAIFVGTAPVSDPRLVIAVVIEDPQAGQYLGGAVAAPVFSKVMGGALRLLDVQPDALATEKVS